MDNTPAQVSPTHPKLLEQVAAKMRVKHSSIRTEKIYMTGLNDIFFTMASDTKRTWARRRRKLF